jgi:hypothetical protein
MDLTSLRALALACNFSAHGVDVTVRRPYPDEDEIPARGIWETQGIEDVPAGSDWTRRGVKRVMALLKSEVPTVPRGTTILAALPGGSTTYGWRVESVERAEAEHYRVIVVRDPDLDLLLDSD